MCFKYVLGLVAGLALTTSISAQTTPIQPTKITPPVQPNLYPNSLYQMNDVGKSLNLTPNQINNLNKLTNKVQAQYRDNFTKVTSLSDIERPVRLQQLNQQYITDWNKGAQDIFNNDQRIRYQQLNHQYGGFNTLNDADVQKRLNLTPGQLKDLNDHVEWNNQQLQGINRMGATDAAKGTQMYQDYWKERQERFSKFLTPEQQKAWLDMTGEPYTFQPNFVRPQ
jgi:hypothetical protein